MRAETVFSGLEQLEHNPPEYLKNKRLGLLCNQASVNRRYQHARDIVARGWPGQLTALFSPQHGFLGEKQDNMIESADQHDDRLQVPIFSLYGATREPTAAMLSHIDVLLVDLQDVGTRVYTFSSTLYHCMQAACRHKLKIVVLDRPNPLGGDVVEGNCLASDCASFVGRLPIPMRHGLTMGELARLYNQQMALHCDLEVIPCKGWRRRMRYADTGLPWVAPSPNLPTSASAVVYPGQVIWEATNISEGRGACLPFEIFGAPFLDLSELYRFIPRDFPGIILRPHAFEPTSNKWQQQVCYGAQIHVIDEACYQPYLTSLHLLQGIIQAWPADFQWKAPPYEYEYTRAPIDLILGDTRIRRQVEAGENLQEIRAAWEPRLREFDRLRQTVWMYN